MTTHQYQQSAPATRGGTDLAAWALIALVVALVCGGAGWALARSASGDMDLERATELAARDGLMRGEASGMAQGARQGRRDAALRARSAVASERRQAAREGYEAGYAEGRSRAGDPDAFVGAGPSSGAYPPAGYEDVLASGMLGADEPGYSDSAYGSFGYGTGSSSPYLGSATGATPGGGW